MELQNALRDKIISILCTMDVRMLDVLLPENGVYEDTFKEMWVSKLISFFKICMLMGDTALTVSYSQSTNKYH
jgi:hypothetical protein